MRGASALGELLARYPDADVQVIVVWEPVLAADGEPTDRVRAPLAADSRVVEYWDPGLWMSSQVVQRMRLIAEAELKEPPPEDQIAWDFIAIFPAGTSWQDPFPVPTWYDGPVLLVLAPVENALRQ